MLLRIFTLSAALTTAKYCFADSPSTSNAYGLPEASSILGLDEDSSSSKHSDSAVQAHGVSITVFFPPISEIIIIIFFNNLCRAFIHGGFTKLFSFVIPC